MGESNGAWGSLETDEQREAWDTYDTLPLRGENPALDSFCERKNISIADLVRLGARLSAPTVLAFAFPGGIKYRDVVTDRRWAYVGSEWHSVKIVPASGNGAGPSDTVIIAEGETDAARLSAHYHCDVAVLPAGAGGWRPSYRDQLVGYERVYVATDADGAGDRAADRILAELPGAVRLRPPASDWCAVDGELPALPSSEVVPTGILVPAGQLLTLDVPESPSFFEGDVFPIGGTLIIHGAFKSFKSWIALDLLAAIATGEVWAGFESTDEPAKVAVVQFEIPWAYYRQRVQHIREGVTDKSAFDTNFLTYSPLARPRLVAGNRESEARVLSEMRSAGVNVVLIDPVRRAVGYADLNSEAEVRPLLRFTEQLNDEGIAVVLVHHDNKAAVKGGGGDPTNMTGSGAWAGDPDSIVSITLPYGEPRDTSTRRNVRFLLRNAPSPAPRSFKLTDQQTIEWYDDPFSDEIPA
jgi:hypothetical protein